MKFYIWLFNLLASDQERFDLALDNNWIKKGYIMSGGYDISMITLTNVKETNYGGFEYRVCILSKFLEFKKHVNWTALIILIFIILTILSEI